MIRAYFKYMGIAVALFLWFMLLGPRMLSGGTELFVLWWFGSLFLIPPFLYLIFKNVFLKYTKKDTE